MTKDIVHRGAGGETPGEVGLDLAGRVAARICHDMASPLGAVANGVDLLGEIGGAGEEELALIRSSSGRAATMMRVLRLAFGVARQDGSEVERAGLADDLSALIAGRRVSFSVSGREGPALAMQDARLVTLMAMSGRALLGLSGRIEVALVPYTEL